MSGAHTVAIHLINTSSVLLRLDTHPTQEHQGHLPKEVSQITPENQQRQDRLVCAGSEIRNIGARSRVEPSVSWIIASCCLIASISGAATLKARRRNLIPLSKAQGGRVRCSQELQTPHLHAQTSCLHTFGPQSEAHGPGSDSKQNAQTDL